MPTIPASAIAQVLPGVVNAGGNALVLNGLMLTTNYRIPVGTVFSFASAAAVGSFFGLASAEYAKATNYFNGYTGGTQLPGALLISQYTPASIGAWLQSGPVSSLTLAQLQAISGTLDITVDGYARSGTINLSSATSFSTAAGDIQTALNTAPVVVATSASAGGTVAAETSTFTGQISGHVLTASSTPSTALYPGAILTVGAASGTQINEQLSGTVGGIGTYSVSIYQSVVANTSFTATYGVMTLTGANASGSFSAGQTLTGGTISANTVLWAQLTGSPVGGAGTYVVSPSQTVSTPATVTGESTSVSVTYDSTSGAFLIASDVAGIPSTIAFATGSAAAPLNMTQATGAVISQGSPGLTPAEFMPGIVNTTQNWASLFLLADPDDGNGNAQKLAFAAWNNSYQNGTRFAFICWDSDITPTESSSAVTSLGYLINTLFGYAGTSLWYDPSNEGFAAFQCGVGASLNFNATNGRTTFAFREQPGLVATVTSQQVGANLIANGYNFYGAYATANQQFVWNYPGSVSGQFLWLDSFMNQIWMNNQFQLALMELLQNIGSLPYNTAGYTMIEQSLQTEIAAALNFGAIRTGIPLSSSEALEINTQAGYPIDQTVTQQGWYLQIQPASAQVRAARTTPVMFFWYTDGQSIQQLTLNSLEII